MRAGARSLRLPQRIVSGFVQTLDFAAVEALHPRPQAMRRRLWAFASPRPRSGWPQPLLQSAGSSRAYSLCALPGRVLRGRCSQRHALALQCADKVHAPYEVQLSLATSLWAQQRRGTFLLRKLEYFARATRGGTDSFTLGTEHKCGVTDTLDFFGRPTASTAERPGLCGRLFYARLPAPLPTHRGPR